METYITTSFEETRELAKKLVSKLDEGTTICLYGDLAAGKTTFTQGIAEYFGIPRLVSPTFIVMRQYPVTNHPIIKQLHHIDLYRMETREDIKAFDIDELWSDPSNLVVIEWPEKFNDIVPVKHIDVHIKIKSENEREISITEHK